MRTLIILLGLLLSAPPLRAAPDPTPQVAALLRQQGLDGAVWTTLDRQGAAGVRDASSRKPMRVDQRVHVGSIAKTVLATGVLRLVSEGRLSLDMPVSALLPGLEFDNPWEASDPLRLRHLLDHSSGLDDARFWHVFSTKAAPDAPLAAGFPSGSGLLRVRHRPGARFSYSNMGYALLGMVIEAVVRQPYEAYLDAALLAPLGMHDSSFAFVSQDREPRLAMGHFENGVTHPALPSHVRPAGQFTTTAADMGRFARFLMSDGSLDGKRFIDPDLLRGMGEPAGTEAAQAGLQVGYALGLRTTDRHGVLAKCHGGNGIGFRATLCLFPRAQKAYFIAINTDSETADYQRFDALLTQSLMPFIAMPGLARALAFDARPWEGWYVPSPNRFESMRLIDAAFGFVRVAGEGGTLQLKPFQGTPVALRHVGNGLFQAPGKTRASHALLISAEGRRILTNGVQSHEQVVPIRLFSLWASLGAGLLGLAAILAKAIARLATRRMSLRDPLMAPAAGALALLLPLPFYYRQSFVQLGDLTIASGLLAIVTAALPVTMLIGLAMALRTKKLNGAGPLAMLAVLQLSLVLAAWGLLPLRLWA